MSDHNRLDWNAVPESVQYIIDYVKKYHTLIPEDDSEPYPVVSEEELKKLHELGKRIKENDDYESVLSPWIDAHWLETDNDEIDVLCRKIHNFFGFLDDLGVSFN